MKVVKLLRRHKANNAGEVCGFPDAEADSLVATGAAVWPNSNTSQATGSQTERATTPLDQGHIQVQSGAAPVQAVTPMVDPIPPGDAPPQPVTDPAAGTTAATVLPPSPEETTGIEPDQQPAADGAKGFTAEQKQAARDLLAAVDEMQFMSWRSQVVKLTGVTALRDKAACIDALNAVINGPDATTDTPAA